MSASDLDKARKTLYQCARDFVALGEYEYGCADELEVSAIAYAQAQPGISRAYQTRIDELEHVLRAILHALSDREDHTARRLIRARILAERALGPERVADASPASHLDPNEVLQRLLDAADRGDSASLRMACDLARLTLGKR